MTVGKSVFECLIIGIVDAVEVVGAAAVTPFVAFQLCLIAVVGFVPDGCGVAAALYGEFHRRYVCGCAVFIEHHVEQVGLRQWSCEGDGVDIFSCESVQRIIRSVDNAESAVVSLHYLFDTLGGYSLYDFAILMEIQIIGRIKR